MAQEPIINNYKRLYSLLIAYLNDERSYRSTEPLQASPQLVEILNKAHDIEILFQLIELVKPS